jgi:hypothetical protein
MSGNRKHQRFIFERPVQYLWDGESQCDSLIDISRGGLRLRTCRELADGAFIKFFVPLPLRPNANAHLCLFLGRVVWRRDGMAGIEFHDLSADASVQLSLFMATQSPVSMTDAA